VLLGAQPPSRRSSRDRSAAVLGIFFRRKGAPADVSASGLSGLRPRSLCLVGVEAIIPHEVPRRLGRGGDEPDIARLVYAIRAIGPCAATDRWALSATRADQRDPSVWQFICRQTGPSENRVIGSVPLCCVPQCRFGLEEITAHKNLCSHLQLDAAGYGRASAIWRFSTTVVASKFDSVTPSSRTPRGGGKSG
jgi:hypothetical protein